MIPVANFIMKGPFQAIMLATVFSALTVWLAPFGIVVGAIIALITLKMGATEGFKVFAIAGVTNLVLTSLLLGSFLPGLISIAEYMLPIWVASVVLRNSDSLALSLKSILLMAGAGVAAFHLFVGDTVVWWKQLYENKFLPLLQNSGLDFSAFALNDLLAMITMLLAMLMVILWFSIVLLGRYWQGALYNAGQFQEDFYQLRLSKGVGYFAVGISLLGLILPNTLLLQDLSGVLMAGLMFQGIAIAHHTVSIKSLGRGWLIGLYFLLFVFPQTVLILVIIGLLDIWMNFRSRWKQDLK